MNIRIKLYLTIVFFLGIFAAFSFFLTRPFYQKINEYSSLLLSAKENLKILESKKKLTKELETNLSGIKEEIAKIEAIGADKSDLVPAIKFLEKTAKELNLNIEIKSVESPAKENAVVFNLALSGPFFGVFKFLKLTENGPYLASLGDFSFLRLQKTFGLPERLAVPLGEGDVAADFKMKIFSKFSNP